MRRSMAAVLLLSVSSAASAMDAATFLARAQALKAKGPFALMSSDLPALKAEVMAAVKANREERLAQIAAGQKPAFCPGGKGSLDSDELIGAMQAVPAAERPRTTVQAALKALMIRKYPCPA